MRCRYANRCFFHRDVIPQGGREGSASLRGRRALIQRQLAGRVIVP
jgi:hypothetical protein